MWSGCDRYTHYSENLDKNHSKTRLLGYGESYEEMLFTHTYNPPPPAIIDLENLEDEINQNLNHQKLIILEGFSQNGYHHLFQRIFLRIIAPVKIDFRHFFEYDIF